MGERVNAGYVITSSVQIGETEFVLGVHKTSPDQFVTWKCTNGVDYYWGHYTDNLLSATKDLCQRGLEEVQFLEQRQEHSSQAKVVKAKNRGQER
ncbi:hypothetical protein [Faecalicatena contorta]|uniref:Uncharacterized protein n=1 Tax=Faecalicatena contorta TaxID=39482 RepID=A0A315ZS29_9FIRM|nr:hypothetical protein [Faecalicatena contorta]PWJ47800.1 hypothetical protein A8805_11655 [Faecalicatena contorta]SUQ15794.1 hypothetical protein SAMN05216529_11655 [Faecalicatena contorta]